MTKLTGRAALSWAVLLVFVAGWALFLRPQFLGGSTAIVGVSGVSMTPTMHDGDLTVVKERSAYDAGDVIAYRIPRGQPGAGNNIIHRIVGGNGGRGFVTRGDYNNGSDLWRPRATDVIGEVVLHVPGGARWLGVLARPTVLAAVLGILTFLILAAPRKRRPGADEFPVPQPPTTVPASATVTGNAKVGTAIAVTATAVAVGVFHGTRSTSARGRTRRSRYSGGASRV